jgi:hypothetical protein
LILPFLLFALSPLSAQEPLSQSQETKRSEPIRDPQALTIIAQSLAMAGGEQAWAGVNDYTASGTIVSYQSRDEQDYGTVTLRGRQTRQFRMDANLPFGVRSYSISEGRSTRKDEDGTILRPPDESTVIPSSDGFPRREPPFPGSLALPHQQLLAALKLRRFSIAYKGTTEVGGRSAHCLRIEQLAPTVEIDPSDEMPRYRTLDVYLDISTLQVLATEALVPRDVLRRLSYTDYRTVGGVMVPFSIQEEMGGQKIWQVTLDQVTFNSGLQDANFEIY